MRRAILVRHGESLLGSEGRLNGVPSLTNPLTPAGEAQARRLGEAVASVPINLCVTSELERVRQTADLALAGRDVPRLVLPELNEIDFGRWEGRPFREYREWAWSHGPEEPCPGGGESRADALRRLVRGWRAVLARPEETVLVVGHGLALRYVLDAAEGGDPKPMLAEVPLAESLEFSAERLEAAVARLDRWLEAPAW